ncbi:MAG TPA: NmrA family NAD(P)-binding protein, partial [Steroidobacteraceae bacterium]|nr:NmrA family NAD(P)-binding protein [Steroidobacteraceae bacterium]
MHIVLGGTGHIGSAVANALLKRREQVTIVGRNREKMRPLQARGAEIAITDILDIEALKSVYRCGDRLFLLNPPADPSTDVAQEERKSVASMLRALDGSGIRKIVAESTFGAQPGEQIGELGVLFELEQGLKQCGIPSTIIRGAYYMSNWDAALESARSEGVIRTFFPVDLALPMVAPKDIGEFAAQRMLGPIGQTGLVHVEGPERYSSAQVAAAFASALQRDVVAATIPESDWSVTLKQLGYSDAAAISFMNMTRIAREGDFPPLAQTVHGTTSLNEYI